MAKKIGKAQLVRNMIDEYYNASVQQAQQQAQAQQRVPAITDSGLTKADIDKMYASAISNQQNATTTTNEIPTLNQPTQATNQQTTTMPTSFPSVTELESQLNDPNAQRTEGETKALEDYISGLKALKEATYKNNYNDEIKRLKAQLDDVTSTRTEGEQKALEEHYANLQTLQKEIDRYNAPKYVPTNTSVQNNKELTSKEKAKKYGEEILAKVKSGKLEDHGYSLSSSEERDKKRAEEAQKNALKNVVTTKQVESTNNNLLSGLNDNTITTGVLARTTPTPTTTEAVNSMIQPMQANSVNKATEKEQTKDNYTIDDLLNAENKWTTNQKNAAKQIVDEYYANNPLAKELNNSNNPNRNMVLLSKMSPEERAEYEKVTALQNRTSNSASFVSGMLDAVPFALKGIDKMLGALGVNEANNLSNQDKALATESPVAHLGGELTSNAALYGLANEVLGSIPAVANMKNTISGGVASKLGTKATDVALNQGTTKATNFLLNGGAEKLGNSVADMVVGTIPDLALDTLPSTIENIQNGDSASQVALKTLGNIGGNVAFNGIAEGVPYLFDALKNTKGATQTVPDVVENAVKQSDEAVKNIDELQGTLNKQEIDEILNAEPQINNPKVDTPKVEAPKVDNASISEKIAKNDAEIEQLKKLLTSDDDSTLQFATTRINQLENNNANLKKQLEGADGLKEATKIEEEGYSGDSFLKDFAEESEPKVDVPDPYAWKQTMRRNLTEANLEDYKADIQYKLDNYVMPEEVRASVNSRLNDLDDIVNSFNKTGSSNEMFEALDKLEILSRDIDSILKGNATIPVQAEGVMSQAKKEFANAMKGRQIKLSGTERGELPDETLRELNNAIYNGNGSGRFYKSKGSELDASVFNEIDEATGKAISSYMTANGLNPDNPLDMARGLTDYARSLKGSSTVTGSLNYDNGDLMYDSFKDIIDKAGKRSDDINANATLDKMKNSKLGTNTMTKLEPEEAAIDLSNGVYAYLPKEGKETMRVASERVSSDPDSWLNTLIKRDVASATSEDVDTSMMLRNKYKRDLKEAELDGDTTTADLLRTKLEALTRKQREMATNGGQVTQAWAKWTRDADGAILAAESISADKFNAISPELKNDADAIANEIKTEIDRLKESELWEELSNAKNEDINPLAQKVNDIIEKAVKSAKNKTISNNLTPDRIDSLSKQLATELKKGEDLEDVLDALERTGTVGFSGIDRSVEDEVRALFDEAEQYGINDIKRVKLENKAYAKLAQATNVTGSFGDKVNALRYFAMLANPKTHIKNTIGNATQGMITNIKDDIAGVLEGVTDKVAKNGIDRTTTFEPGIMKATVDRKLYAAAKKNADESYRLISDGNKYYDSGRSILSQAPTFKNKGLGKVANALTEANTKALDKEDWWGLKNKYADSLTRHIKSNGGNEKIFDDIKQYDSLYEQYLDAKEMGDPIANQLKTQLDSLQGSKDLFGKAQEHAIQQAKEATFHQENKLAQKISETSRTLLQSDKWSDRIAGMLIEGILPFKKTNLNIVETLAHYSPTNLALGSESVLSESAKKALKKGDVKASDIIESIAKTATGTGLLAIGYGLAKKGVLIGGESDTPNLDKLVSKQNYSLKLGDQTYTLSWLSPSGTMMLVGANMAQGNNDMSLEDFMSSIASVGEPMLETTMLSSLADALNSVKYSDGGWDTLSQFASTGLSDLGSQFVPSELGNIQRGIDTTKYSTYTDKTGINGILPRAINSIENKLPGYNGEHGLGARLVEKIPELENTALAPNYPKLDAWGREQKYSDNEGLIPNLVYQHFSPGYYDKENVTEVDKFLQKFNTDDVTPQSPKASFEYQNEKRRANEGEYYTMSKTQGETSYNLLDSLVKNQDFLNLDDEGQMNVIKSVYSVAKKEGLASIIEDYESSDKDYSNYKENGAESFLNDLIKDNKVDSRNISEALKNKEEGTSEASAVLNYLDSVEGMSKEEKGKYLYDNLDGNKTTNEYASKDKWADVYDYYTDQQTAKSYNMSENKYETATTVFGDDEFRLKDFGSWQNSLKNGNLEKKINSLDDYGMSLEVQGQYLAADQNDFDKTNESGRRTKASEAYNKVGYAGYMLMKQTNSKTLYDYDGNGKISWKDYYGALVDDGYSKSDAEAYAEMLFNIYKNKY